MSMKYNNNPKNTKKFLEYQRRQLELSRRTQEEARRLKIESNLDRWIGNLPKNLQIAVPANAPARTVDRLREVNIKPPFYKNVIITSRNTTSSLFTAHTLIYALIKAGSVTPSEIKRTSLLDGYNNINGMFESRKWKDYFFDRDAKVLLIEGSSKSLTSLAPRGEDQFWKELIEFTRDGEKLIILTYTSNEEESEQRVFIPTVTNDSSINADLVKGSNFIALSQKEEEEIRIEQSKAY